MFSFSLSTFALQRYTFPLEGHRFLHVFFCANGINPYLCRHIDTRQIMDKDFRKPTVHNMKRRSYSHDYCRSGYYHITISATKVLHQPLGQIATQRAYIRANPRSRLLRTTNRQWLQPQRHTVNTILRPSAWMTAPLVACFCCRPGPISSGATRKTSPHSFAKP